MNRLKLRFGLNLVFLFLILGCQDQISNTNSIDRFQLVSRHHVKYDTIQNKAPLSVGNGGFGFTVDFTGLQSFPEAYEVPLLTQAEWGWHSFPNPNNFTLTDASEKLSFAGKENMYPIQGYPNKYTPAATWLNHNPHKIMLGRLGFQLKKSDGTVASLEELTPKQQTWNLWEGTIESQFLFEGQLVTVQTQVHPEEDIVLLSINSPFIKEEKIGINVSFPYVKTAQPNPADWSSPEQHLTIYSQEKNGAGVFNRTLDTTHYQVGIISEEAFATEQGGLHTYTVYPQTSKESWEVAFAFSPEKPNVNFDFKNYSAQVVNHWESFWQNGGAIDFSGSTDPRAFELERRLVLSQFLMAIQCAGKYPPQETGLTANSWHGKFHLEMHWWHAAHFPLWGRPHLLEKSMDWYLAHLPKAKALAKSQGYEGARWPKMVGPEGRESPGMINPFILWQQPHTIYFSVLLYQNDSSKETLEKYAPLVFETADFLASRVTWDENSERFNIVSPVSPMQEVHNAFDVVNPSFELAYFSFGLRKAQQWRTRMGLPEDEKWAQVIKYLAPLPQKDGLYLAVASRPDMWETAYSDTCKNGYGYSTHDFLNNPCQNVDHPSLVGSLGFLDGKNVDKQTMKNTLEKVMDIWDYNRLWGWDFPLLAMTAAKVGDPELAIDILLMDHPKNNYNINGWMEQASVINPYLPANGGLLTAVAMMAAGWNGDEGIPAPGFPKNGKWSIKYENINKSL